jgi:hypothetical protein
MRDPAGVIASLICWRPRALGSVRKAGWRRRVHWRATCPVVTTVDTGDAVVGSGDVNGDGKADILRWHTTRGEVWLWRMNGATPLSQSYVGVVPGTGFQIVKTR